MQTNSNFLKNTISSLLLLILFTPDSFAQKEMVVNIEFNSTTRGYQENIKISHYTFSYRKIERGDSLSFSTAMTEKMWSKLIKTIPIENLTQVNALHSPTKKRTYDGARHSTLTLKTMSDRFTHSFDNESPNHLLESLLDKIICMCDELNPNKY